MDDLRAALQAAQEHHDALGRRLVRLQYLLGLVAPEDAGSAAPGLIQPASSPEGEHIHLVDYPAAVKLPCDVAGCPWTP